MTIKDNVITAANSVKNRMWKDRNEFIDYIQRNYPDLAPKQISRAIRDIPMIIKAGNGYRIKGRSVPEKVQENVLEGS